MFWGYNTNGFGFHRWRDSLQILADLGYEGVGLTLDVHCLDPYAANAAAEVQRCAALLDRLKLRCCIETGARFLLDPRRKHFPVLVSSDAAERARRRDFLQRSVEIAGDLNADAVSFWSGVVPDGVSNETAVAHLADECRRLVDFADSRPVPVRLAFEPEPGMLVATFDDFRPLAARINHPLFGLTVDLGHVHCIESDPDIARHVREWSPLIFNIHAEDMRRGVHDHLRFGDGEIDFAPVMRALHEVDYRFGVYVELSRHGHMAPDVARESLEFLRSTVSR